MAQLTLVDAVLAYPNAPHRVNPTAPTRFQNPTCHPILLSSILHHFFCSSNVKSKLEMMNPIPPMTCGLQKNMMVMALGGQAVVSEGITFGRPVTVDTQNIVAAKS